MVKAIDGTISSNDIQLSNNQPVRKSIPAADRAIAESISTASSSEFIGRAAARVSNNEQKLLNFFGIASMGALNALFRTDKIPHKRIFHIAAAIRNYGMFSHLRSNIVDPWITKMAQRNVDEHVSSDELVVLAGCGNKRALKILKENRNHEQDHRARLTDVDTFLVLMDKKGQPTQGFFGPTNGNDCFMRFAAPHVRSEGVQWHHVDGYEPSRETLRLWNTFGLPRGLNVLTEQRCMLWQIASAVKNKFENGNASAFNHIAHSFEADYLIKTGGPFRHLINLVLDAYKRNSTPLDDAGRKLIDTLIKASLSRGQHYKIDNGTAAAIRNHLVRSGETNIDISEHFWLNADIHFILRILKGELGCRISTGKTIPQAVMKRLLADKRYVNSHNYKQINEDLDQIIMKLGQHDPNYGSYANNRDNFYYKSASEIIPDLINGSDDAEYINWLRGLENSHYFKSGDLLLALWTLLRQLIVIIFSK